MYAVQDQLGDKDLSRTRVFQLENGNKLYAKQTDPYGFWYLNLDKGQLPPWLADQAFNEWSQVLKAVERYGNDRKVVIQEIRKGK
jgi:hypothetical protein